MRKTILYCLLMVMTLSLSARKKVAVVLSGGGAKGMAHIGALRVIEEAGIPIDMIVGTSMGSIIGGMYAIGYTPDQMDSLVRIQSWEHILSDNVERSFQNLESRADSKKYFLTRSLTIEKDLSPFSGVIKGENLSDLFSNLTIGFHDSIDFNKLPIPFACVACDLGTGKEVHFHHGILKIAMRASMAIPGAFTPVRMDSMILVDGGMKNNYPVDVAKKMGADIVIGVSVQGKLLKANKIKTIGDQFSQILSLATRNKFEDNKANTDIFIDVPVEGFSTISFNSAAIDSLIRRGEETARRQKKSLLALKRKIGIPISYVPPKHGPYNLRRDQKDLFISRFTFEGMSQSDKKSFMRRNKLKDGMYFSEREINKMLASLRLMCTYSNVSYRLERDKEGCILHFLLKEKYDKQISVGANFNSEDIATLLVKGSLFWRKKLHSKLDLTAQINKRFLTQITYTMEPVLMRDISFSYRLLGNDVDVYNDGRRISNVNYLNHTAEIKLSDQWFRNLKYEIGAQFDYFHMKDLLLGGDLFPKVEDSHFFNYFANIIYDSYDKNYFPEAGTGLKLGFKLFTDNFFQYKNSPPIYSVDGSLERVCHITNRLVFIPSVYGRILFENPGGTMYNNTFGGLGNTTLFDSQMPFVGIDSVEYGDNIFGAGLLKIRQRMGSRHYLTLLLNYGLTEDKLDDLFKKGKSLFGAGLQYGVETPFGPIVATMHYYNRSQKVGFYINIGSYF